MRSLTLLLTAAVLMLGGVAGVPAPAGAATPAGATRVAAQDPSDPQPPTLPGAQAALEQVKDLLTPPAQKSGAASRHDDLLDTTLALLGLASSKSELPAGQREEAEKILARPTDGQNGDPDGYKYPEETAENCTGPVCVHWATNKDDPHYAAPPTGNGYTNSVVTAMRHVYDTYQDMGYRAPPEDKGTPANGRGPDGKVDIYLADLAPTNAFGYCTTDDPRGDDIYKHGAVYSYCVLDNNYTDPVYGDDHTPTEYMQVTAAHEFFHAVQFGYDAAEDLWFMEATATWAEDEVYPDINDNLFFLPGGPMTRPRIPLDDPAGGWYGGWIFFRYLSERFGAGVVRSMWNRADAATKDARDQYSLAAVRGVVANKTDWNDAWRRFAEANRRPGRFYRDMKDKSVAYPHAAPYQSVTLRAANPGRTSRPNLRHLTSAALRFAPESSMKTGWKLRVEVDGSKPEWGGAALLTVRTADGGYREIPLDYDESGHVLRRITFGSDAVQWAEVIVVNASTRHKCWQQWNDPQPPTCEGYPRDDDRPTTVAVKAVRSQ